MIPLSTLLATLGQCEGFYVRCDDGRPGVDVCAETTTLRGAQ
jgi:hypothetical protein